MARVLGWTMDEVRQHQLADLMALTTVLDDENKAKKAAANKRRRRR